MAPTRAGWACHAARTSSDVQTRPKLLARIFRLTSCNSTLPAALPFIFAGLRVGLVRGINAMITAELFLAATNLGALMKLSAKRFDMAGLLSIVALLCLLGLIAQGGLKAMESRLLPWHVRG